MRLDEYAELDATALAQTIRAGEITARDAVRLVREAAVLTERVNAIAELYDDPVEASDTDTDAPFWGVPILMKDVGFHEAGREAPAGSAILEGVRAPSHSELMQRLMRAGLVSVGRSTASEFAIMATVETRLHGLTRNPWDERLIAGGSSGGAAAAVAAGIVPVAHGNDGGGSIRMPAACCGVVGLKPSRGLVTSSPYRVPLGDLVYEFVVTRSVRDAATMLDAVGGSHTTDAYDTPAQAGGYSSALRAPLRRLRIGYTFDRLDGRPVDAEVRAGVERAVQRCVELGHEVVECAPTFGSYEAYIEATLRVWGVETAIAVDSAAAMTGRPADENFLEGLTVAWAQHGREATPSAVGRALDTLDNVRREMATFMQGIDVLLSSTLPVLPPEVGRHYDPDSHVDAEWYYQSEIGQLEATTMVFNCSGQPAISLPLEWTSDGLPIGIHFAGSRGADGLLLQLAAELESADPWADRIPMLNVRALTGRDREPL